MAEISFPFDDDNALGGSKVVAQTQWQQVGTGWGDYADFPLQNNSYTDAELPFSASLTGREVTVKAGSARVGGFYYKLSGTKKFTVPSNTSGKPRTDMIVIRADMAKSAVTMEYIEGTPATNPVEPQPTRRAGGVWEMAVMTVENPANNGTPLLARRLPHPMPAPVAFPWNVADSTDLLPMGSFTYDLDVNNNEVQWESFNGRDGFVRTRTFGKSRKFTPDTLNGNATLPSSYRNGRWRWIAPNVFWFAVNLDIFWEDRGISVSGSNTRLGVTLPVATNRASYQTLHGYLNNPYGGGGAPNLMAITALTAPGSTGLYLYTQNWTKLSSGLDGLRAFPPRSKFYISGVIEANQFNE